MATHPTVRKPTVYSERSSLVGFYVGITFIGAFVRTITLSLLKQTTQKLDKNRDEVSRRIRYR